MTFFIGRSGGIRPHDPYVPNVVLYQAEPHSDKECFFIYSFQKLCKHFFIFLFIYIFSAQPGLDKSCFQAKNKAVFLLHQGV